MLVELSTDKTVSEAAAALQAADAVGGTFGGVGRHDPAVAKGLMAFAKFSRGKSS